MGRYGLYDDDDDDDEHVDRHEYEEKPLSSALIHVRTTNNEEEDASHYDENDDQDASNSQALNNNWNSNQQAPVHYHVYYSDPSEDQHSNKRRSSSSSSRWWFWISLMAVVSHIVYWYGPCVPPCAEDSAETWPAFFQQQSSLLLQLATTWIQVGYYVSFWCWQAIQEDYWHWQQPKQQQRNMHPEGCRYVGWSEIEMDDHRSKSSLVVVFGQDAALSRMRSALQTWNQENPLVFYATGGKAVGKQSLARILIEDSFVGCGGSENDDDDDDDDNNNNDNDVLLHVRPPDLATTDDDDAEEDSSSVPALLYSRVLDHVTKHPNGSILLLSHVEEWNDSRMLSRFLSQIMTVENQNNGMFSKCIIVITSNVGKATIDKTLRRYGGRDQLPLIELESFLSYEIENYHSPQDGKEEPDDSTEAATLDTTSTTTPTTATVKSMFSYSDNIIMLPFLPLDRNAMGQILEYQLQATLDIQRVTDGALDYLLEHTIEWQTWIQKKTGQVLVTFAPLGAKAATPILYRIPLECRPTNQNRKMKTTTTTTTTTLDLVLEGRFQVVVCPDGDHDKSDDDDSEEETLTDECQQVCQFIM